MFKTTALSLRILILGLSVSLLSGCAMTVNKDPVAADVSKPAGLTPMSSTYLDLINLPKPKGKVLVSVYGFKDQTGQYKKTPDSNFSTAVTQGGGAMLVNALLDSKWFIPVEREGLQNLLTERKIIRAAQKKQNSDKELSPLMSANVLFEGGIVAYESNVQTGGIGVRYFGIGASDLYQKDQVTISLRAVDIRTGRVLKSILTSKTIYSYEVDSSFYRFVSYKKLLEAEAGYTRNEPAQLCVLNAIEAAVIQMIVQGVKDNIWQLADETDIDNPIFQDYLLEYQQQISQIPMQQL